MSRKFIASIMACGVLAGCGVYAKDGEFSPELKAHPLFIFFQSFSGEVDEATMRELEAQADAAARDEDKPETPSGPNG